jgi:hypothetical protein
MSKAETLQLIKDGGSGNPQAPLNRNLSEGHQDGYGLR